jgi:hypothetical protein
LVLLLPMSMANRFFMIDRKIVGSQN